MTNIINILLFGYWERNLGDDLFLKVISERFPKIRFHIVIDEKYRSTYQAFSHVQLHFRRSSYTFKILNRVLLMLHQPGIYYTSLAKKCDGAIFYGGSLYQQGTSWKRSAQVRSYIARTFPACFVIGSNFGPYHEQAYFDFYHALFSKMKDICFRDKYSAQLFADLSVRNAPDVVLALDKQFLHSSCNKNLNLRKRPYMVISVIDLKHASISRQEIRKYRAAYERWIADLALAVEQRGMDVLFLNFCEREGDHEACARILSMLDDKRALAHTHQDIEESLQILNGAQGVIATRFHAMILGWVLEKPVFPIVYGQKMQSVITEYGYDGTYANISKLEAISPDAALDNMHVFEKVDFLAEEAKHQFDGFEEWQRL